MTLPTIGSAFFCRSRDCGDLELVLETDGVLDETGGEGVFEGADLAVGEAGDGDFDEEAAEVEGAGGGLSPAANGESPGGEAARGEVLGDILADAAAEGGEEEFGGGHALVGSAVFDGLVEDQAMMAGLGGEARSSIVVQRDLQNTLLVCQLSCKRKAIVRRRRKQA